ncbi:MAG: redoxin domain-containing protein [Myxococcales bacterium]
MGLPLHLTLGIWLFLLAACASSPTSVHSGPALTLTSPEGTRWTLAKLSSDQQATVLVFWSATCPCVRRYQERVDSLLDRYPQVRVLGVSSNAGESAADVLRVANERRVRIPIYRDDGGEVARALGARSTPTVVVLDARGNVRFLGWLDNERLPGDTGRQPWLDRALQGILDGHTDFSSRTPTYGCTITRSLFGAPSSSCCSH